MRPLHERTHYRVVYPIAVRPILVVESARLAVIDLSEGGLRLEAPGRAWEHLAPIRGTLLLPETEPIEIEGQVIRREDRCLAVAFERGLPFGVILSQQRFLLRRSPAWR